jgi:hypothetical protein
MPTPHSNANDTRFHMGLLSSPPLGRGLRCAKIFGFQHEPVPTGSEMIAVGEGTLFVPEPTEDFDIRARVILRMAIVAKVASLVFEQRKKPSFQRQKLGFGG